LRLVASPWPWSATCGWIAAGLIMTTFLVAGVSGSKLADVVAVGSIMREQLAQRDTGAGRAVCWPRRLVGDDPALDRHARSGSVVPVSIGDMFVAGLLPAATLAVILMILVWFMAGRHPTLPVAKAGGRNARGSRWGLLPAAMPRSSSSGSREG